MEPANPLLPVWYTTPYSVDYNMSYPSPAPSDPSPVPRPHHTLDPYPDYSQLTPSSGPDRQRRQSDVYALPAAGYAPYDPSRHRASPRSASVMDSVRVPSPTLSSVSSMSSHHSPLHSASPGAPSSRPLPLAQRREQHKHTKHRLRNVDRKNICLYQIEHPHARQEDIGAEFNVERSTISKILKDRHRWLNISPEDESNEHTAKHRPSKFPEIESEMRKSLQQWTDQGINITDNIIRTRALEIAAGHDISTERFKGSSGWVENFKSRHDIRRGEWQQAVRYGPTIRGARVAINQTMGMGYDEHGNPNTHSYRDTQQQLHPLPLPHEARHWSSSSHTSSPAEPSSAVALDPALQQQSQTRSQPQEAPASSISSSSSSSSSTGSEIHTPLQSRLPLDPSAIQHSPDGYDAHTGTGARGGYMHSSHQHQEQYSHHAQQQQQQQQPQPQHTEMQYARPVAEAAPQQVEIPLAVIGDHPPPSLQEAEDAMNVVISFIDRCAPEGFLKPTERDALTHVKCAMFNLASGMPYAR